MIGVIKNMKPEVIKNPKIITVSDVFKIIQIGSLRFDIADKEHYFLYKQILAILLSPGL